MFVDFNRYNNEIIAVKLNEEDDVLEMQTSLYKINLTAVGDCCSVSKLKKFKDNDFNNLIGKIIKKIKEIDVPKDFIYEDEEDYIHPDDDTTSIHLYEIKFKNSDETFKFILVNYSNGYYDGWLNTNIVL